MKKSKTMYAISNWASRHKLASRAIVILLNFVLYGLAMYLAVLLQKGGDPIPVSFWGWAMLIAFAGAFITGQIYKGKSRLAINKMHKYWQRRLKYGLVAIGSFCLVVFVYQSDAHLTVNAFSPLHGSFVSKKTEAKEKPQYNAYEDKMLFYKDLKDYYKTVGKKELRKELKQAKQNKKEGNNNGGDAGYIILIILVALVAMYLLAALACTISCGGSEALAVIVFLGGTAGIVLGTIALIKGLKRRRLAREQRI